MIIDHSAINYAEKTVTVWRFILDFVVKNLRLAELITVVNANREYFNEFVVFLQNHGYATIREFIAETSDEKAVAVIKSYLTLHSETQFFDGIFRPFPEAKARWYFLAWIFRDAPAQRLNPLILHMPGASKLEKQTHILNEIRKFVNPLFPNEKQWDWYTLAEIFLNRLEGSRRSLKGNLFEGIIRKILTELFAEHNLHLHISQGQRKLNDETYDIEIIGVKGSILIPVKTRETMGGGHAMLFTRDIHKSISVAVSEGFTCIPIIIAESWGGDLSGLACNSFIHIRANPNQIHEIAPLLIMELEKNIKLFENINS